MRKAAAFGLALMILLVGCSAGRVGEALQGGGLSQMFNGSTTVFETITWKRLNNLCSVQGTVRLKNDNNGVIAWLDALEGEEIHVTGTLRRQSGEIQLVYAAPDGTEAPVAENEDGTIDTTLILSAGKGELRFAGEALCDFDLQFELTDGISFSWKKE